MNMTETRLNIEGMSCGHCVARVRSTLQKIPGIDIVSVELGRAVVRHPEGETSPEAIAGALTSDGYPATHETA